MGQYCPLTERRNSTFSRMFIQLCIRLHFGCSELSAACWFGSCEISAHTGEYSI